MTNPINNNPLTLNESLLNKEFDKSTLQIIRKIDKNLYDNIRLEEDGDLVVSESSRHIIEAYQQITRARMLLEKAKATLSAETVKQIIEPLDTFAASFNPPPSDEEGEADFITYGGVVGDLIGSFGIVIWVASVLDDTVELPMSDIGYSWWGLGVGCMISLILSLAELQCHKIINIINQSMKTVSAVADLKNTHLTKLQTLALVLESIKHAGEVGGELAFITRIFKLSNPWIKSAIHIGGTALLGSWKSGADTRTHYWSMLKYNYFFNTPKKAAEESEDSIVEIIDQRPHQQHYHRMMEK